MNRMVGHSNLGLAAVPRTRGDEPTIMATEIVRRARSPHTRG